MINLYSPNSEAELAVIKSLLQGEGIPFFVHNDNFGSLYMGLKVDLLNKKTIMVDEEFEESAKELLSDFLNNTESDSSPRSTNYSLLDKIRMILEGIFFTWIIPGKKWRKDRKQKNPDD
ncbi:MAG: DUF2007 domain-containing protein [bacterium]|nr:DUF2007 domain-containing protein [bacterium]